MNLPYDLSTRPVVIAQDSLGPIYKKNKEKRGEGEPSCLQIW